MILEVCVDSLESARAAVAGGADRLEVCSALGVGGLTPSSGLLELVIQQAAGRPCLAMIRPREGGFVYAADDAAVILQDVATVKRLGAAGVVFGALRESGEVDLELTAAVVSAARPLQVTFHRAFDICQSPADALESLVELGVDRILTSGSAPSAPAGTKNLARLVRQAAGRIEIVAGAGIQAENVIALVQQTSVREIHASASISAAECDSSLFELGSARRTQQQLVRALVDQLALVGSE